MLKISYNATLLSQYHDLYDGIIMIIWYWHCFYDPNLHQYLTKTQILSWTIHYWYFLDDSILRLMNVYHNFWLFGCGILQLSTYKLNNLAPVSVLTVLRIEVLLSDFRGFICCWSGGGRMEACMVGGGGAPPPKPLFPTCKYHPHTHLEIHMYHILKYTQVHQHQTFESPSTHLWFLLNSCLLFSYFICIGFLSSQVKTIISYKCS